MEEIRWTQRFQNLRFAFGQLCEFMEAGELNKFETQGLVKCFEYTFELSWKTLKDFLEEEGFSISNHHVILLNKPFNQVTSFKGDYGWKH